MNVVFAAFVAFLLGLFSMPVPNVQSATPAAAASPPSRSLAVRPAPTKPIATMTPAAPGAQIQRPPAPTGLTLSPVGSGSTTWAYKVVAFNAAGDGLPSVEARITNGPNQMAAGYWTPGGPEIWISWQRVDGADGYRVIRTVSGPTPPDGICRGAYVVHNMGAFDPASGIIGTAWGDNGAGCGLGLYVPR